MSVSKSTLLCLFLAYNVCAQINFGPPPVDTEDKKVPEKVEVGERFGLLSTLLDKDPLGRDPNANNQQSNPQNVPNNPNNNGGQNGNFQTLDDLLNPKTACCCSSSNFACPQTNTQRNEDLVSDDQGFSGLNPRFKDPNNEEINSSIRSGDDDDDLAAELDGGLGVRIVNEPAQFCDAPEDSCPRGTQKCCYSSNTNINSFGSSCQPLGQKPFTPWNQGCNQRNSNPGNRKQCGTRSYQPIPNLGDCALASPEEFPWVCMMLTDSDRFLGSCAVVPESSDNDITSGTYRVITAAHKLGSLTKNEALKIRIIEYDGSGFVESEKNQHEDYIVSRFVTHPDFNKKRLSDDIAVIILERPINLVSKAGVNAACYPACNNMFEHQFSNGTGVRCWVAGWGRTGEDKDFSFVQRKVDVPMYDRTRCENKMKQELAPRFRLRPGEVCAGGEAGKDSCDGDGGAPLVCQSQEGNWHVVGLVAWGVGCANPDVPGIYVNVHHYLDFITAASHRRSG